MVIEVLFARINEFLDIFNPLFRLWQSGIVVGEMA